MKKKFHHIVLLLLLLLSMVAPAQVDFSLNSNYSYLKGSDAGSLSGNWMTPAFNPSGWQTGNAPFRYGDGIGGVLLNDMQLNYSNVYLRSTFQAVGVDNINELIFTVDYDDGFVLWVNGEKILERNAPDLLNNTSFAPINHESGTPEVIVLSSSGIPLLEGNNLIAVQGINISLESSDFYFDLSIKGERELQKLNDSLEVTFSHNAGFYTAPFNLKLTAPNTSYQIKFTTDGSNPQSSSTALTGTSGVQVRIDPKSTLNRAQTPAYILRASLSTEGFLTSIPVNRTYIFTNEVIAQTHPGGDWPTRNINNQIMDFEMDPEITNSTDYASQMQQALTDIPTISVATDLENLFGENEGIYVNADQRGLEWEKFSSVELIDPKGNEDGFSTNAGLRIRGGWSRHDDFPKHSFRLFFRKGYGDGKLNYPLFGEEGTDQFDKIDLRTAQNYAWSNGFNNNTFVRDVFSRDSQRDMNRPYTRSRYYHLYLNGMYWGLYQTQERAEAKFASDYIGGSSSDYDVIKTNGENYSNWVEATDGNMDAWVRIYAMCNAGFGSNARYFELEGKNAQGMPVKGGEILVDIDNLIDYMITIFYTGNFDSPSTKFGGDQKANNFFAIYKRDDKTNGFVFFCHDAEHSLMFEGHSPGIGLYENRVTIPGMNASTISRFSPQWLHHKLTSNAEYRMRFADRVQKHLFDDGVFTPELAKQRMDERVSQIDKAIIAESARWGDAKYRDVKTRDANWLPEINKIRSIFFPQRTEIVVGQLKAANLCSSVEAPFLKNGSDKINVEHIDLQNNSNLTINNPTSSGKIYLTTNGRDPRNIGGSVSASALVFANGTALNIDKTTMLNARILNNSTWSALKQYHLLSTNDDFSKLKVTELHYNPLDSIVNGDTIPGKSFEFVEIKNTGETALNLSNLTLDSMVSFTFPLHTLIAPQEHMVLASKPKWFYERYGRVPSGNFQNNMSNDGEEFILKNDANDYLIHFFYANSYPWPSEPNGTGFSLTANAVSPVLNPNNFLYWRSSSIVGGTPFADDLSLINDLKSQLIIDSRIAVYPNPCKGMLHIQLLGEQWADHIEIWTLTGKLLARISFSGNASLDLRRYSVSNGMLLIKVTGGGRSELTKLIYQPY